ncbi:hypothetical protein K2W90_03065 [Candidatus Babeliales bacterium]|nr:hypothetical protein [Candidatus Babeliales bacterium]
MKLIIKLLAITGLLLNLSSLQAAAGRVGAPVVQVTDLTQQSDMGTFITATPGNPDHGAAVATVLSTAPIYARLDGSRIVTLTPAQAADLVAYFQNDPAQVRSRLATDGQLVIDQLENPDHAAPAAQAISQFKPALEKSWKQAHPKKAKLKQARNVLFWTGVVVIGAVMIIIPVIVLTQASSRTEEYLTERVWGQLNEYFNMLLTYIFNEFHERVIAYGKFSADVTTSFIRNNATFAAEQLTRIIPTIEDTSKAFNATTTALYQEITPRVFEIGKVSNDTIASIANYLLETGRVSSETLLTFINHNLTLTFDRAAELLNVTSEYNTTHTCPALQILPNVTCPPCSTVTGTLIDLTSGASSMLSSAWNALPSFASSSTPEITDVLAHLD